MAKQKKYDILICGGLCSNDSIFGEYLARKGLRVCVAKLREYSSDGKVSEPAHNLTADNSNQVITVKGPGQLIRLAKESRLVLTFTGSFGFAIKWRWFFRKLFRIPPVVNIPTGSDFSELLAERSRAGWFYRYFARTCDLNQGLGYPHIIKNMIRYKIKNVAFMRHAYFITDAKQESAVRQEGKLRYFHPSHLDFKVNDPGEHRTSSKGNDRFLRAFIRALANGLDAECVILDRGPDRDIARGIIADSGFSDRFIWKPHLSREEMIEEYRTADVIVDQFDVGGLGGIAIEAMAMARPVLIYLQTSCLNITYAEHPPVLNAHSEQEIYDRIMENGDREKLVNIGLKARQWVNNNHDGETCLDLFLFYYTLITGHKVVDYGWDTDPYSDQ